MKNGKFVILEGIDGAGKTTLSQIVCEQMGIRNIARKSVSQIFPFVDSQMLKHKELLWTETGEYDHVLPTTYWIHLQAAWHILSAEFVVKPVLEQGIHVLMDGWYYKLMARLWLQGEDRDFVQNSFSKIMEPDYVILLNVDYDATFERKTAFRAYEYGKFKDGRVNENKSSFIQYQRGTFCELQKMKKDNWSELILGNCCLEESVILLREKLLEVL